MLEGDNHRDKLERTEAQPGPYETGGLKRGATEGQSRDQLAESPAPKTAYQAVGGDTAGRSLIRAGLAPYYESECACVTLLLGSS
ncbi:hypothetical protein cyc_05840 [Cyclospora cayetanensis]|uniref:Uncharacterized protein n=1 Tax=Cyclospora cayetanensis TaxID=88456 RepID=A0A1D3D0G3_9EIME|nr:hypothetical protein cyc_05840 [Cyclospora cayetanensis]